MTEMATPRATPISPATDQALPVAARMTPLAHLLAQQNANVEIAEYCGALTPQKFDAPETETAALVSGAAVHDLGWMRRVSVRGEDRFRWLSGMVTNTVNELASNAGAWNLVLNAQGRIQGDLHIWRDGGELELGIAADQYEKLLAHLDRFIIMDDVELVPTSLHSSLNANGDLNGETALGLAGPQAASLLTRLKLTTPLEPLTQARATWNESQIRIVRAYGTLVPRFELWVQAAEVPALWQALIDAGATPIGSATVEAFRIAEGIPVYGIDIAERDLAQETSQLRALNFNKGCYLGQEIVERIHSRGNVHRHLRMLEVFGPVPAPGIGLTLPDGAAAGQITSAAKLMLANGPRVFALAMMRGEAELASQSLNYAVGASNGTARILAAPPVL